MDKRIKELIKMLESSNSNFARECLSVLKEEEIIINSSSRNSVKNLTVAYTRREKTQNKIAADIEKEVFGYQSLLNELKKYNEELILSTIVVSNPKNGFILLYSEHDLVLVSILKTENVNLEKSKQLIKTYKSRGLSNNYCHYNKGILIECCGTL